ncbi:unnamed protein product [Cylindrotheca closterium]|uniref:Uncharacterized protein n=1 Tax=Cylindrotheca closterium TaxID=2856 RepID=A0AAD2FW94_9STRA|nr:unnamed protein product [Cylindrotheca closterium]
MGWSDTWKDILDGGNQRWKVDNLDAKKIALKHITDNTITSSARKLKILCPLAGDDKFVFHAWSEGHDVTAIDLVPEAVAAMRQQFGSSTDGWTSTPKEDEGLVWKHDSGRVTLYEGDMLKKRSELENSFDAIYDKDSYGALTKDIRPAFCQRLSDYAKDGATLYIEVKNKASGREHGPPFHVEKSDLMESTSFGPYFNHVTALGELYPLPMPGMQQTGHILKRMLRK